MAHVSPRDPTVLIGSRVVAFYGMDGATKAIGEVVGYMARPTFVIKTDDGEKFHWADFLVRPATPEDEENNMAGVTPEETPVQNETDALLASRREVYGDRIENMESTAKIWSGFLGVEIQPWQVPVMMALYKMYRMRHAHDYSDNIDDAKGWLKMFEEVVGEDMVTARTVEEYLDGRKARDSAKSRGPVTVPPGTYQSVDELIRDHIPQEGDIYVNGRFTGKNVLDQTDGQNIAAFNAKAREVLRDGIMNDQRDAPERPYTD